MPAQFRPLLIIAVIFLGFPVYFLPAFIAAKREHPARRKLLLWNLLTAWTGIGWIIVLLLSVQGISVPEEKETKE